MRFVSSRFARFALTASLALFGLSFTAHAATLAGISVSVINSSQLSGSLSIDFLNGTQSGSFIFFDGTTHYSFTLADEVDSDGQGASPDGYAFLDFVDASGNELWLAHSNAISATDVFSYVDYLLCSVAHPCSVESTTGFVTYFVPNGGDPLYLSDGTFHETATFSSATPEPSSFALLGTGVLGTFGAVRRRFRRA